MTIIVNQFHVILSMLTLLVLTIAGLLASLLAAQERFLRNKSLAAWVSKKLPPLQAMETYLFWVNRWGFILLTGVLMTSFYFYRHLLWLHPELLPKTLMAVMAWIIFLILLIGRHWRGWRGAQAINSTLCGVILLLIVSLASHFII